MEQQINRAGLNDNYKRNAEHEFDMLGFVADEQHCDEHSDTAAKCGEQKQGLFGNAKFHAVFLGYLLIVNADDDGYERYDRQICNNKR